jgi:hypothetical protein
MTYHGVCNLSNTTGATSVAGTAYISGTSELNDTPAPLVTHELPTKEGLTEHRFYVEMVAYITTGN